MRGVSHVQGDRRGCGASSMFEMMRGGLAMFKVMGGGEGRHPCSK